MRTNQYAAELIGRTKQDLFNSSSTSVSVNWLDVMLGTNSDNSQTMGMNEVFEHEVQPREFTTLAKGGPPNWMAEAIIVQGGRRFESTGSCWIPVTIPQQL